MERFVFCDAVSTLNRIYRLQQQGEPFEVLCEVCGSPLIVATTPEAAAKYRVHPGIYCPKSAFPKPDQHTYVRITLASDSSPRDTNWLEKYERKYNVKLTGTMRMVPPPRKDAEPGGSQGQKKTEHPQSP